MKNIGISIILLALIIGFASCEKAVVEELSKPTVHIHKPIDEAMYNSGDTVWVKVHFEDEDELHEYSVEITNTTDSTEILHLHGHSHTTTFEIDTFVIPTVTLHTPFKLKAEISNHNSLSSTAELDFHVHP
jgi:hypothetical protein